MSTQSLAVIDQNQEQAIQVGGLGLRGVESLKPGPMVLVQPTTEVEGILPGLFLDKLSGTTWKTLKLVPLRIRFPRKGLYPSAPRFVKGERPLCKSYDGIRPVTNNPDLTPQAPSCKACPQGQWKKAGGRNIKPLCPENAEILFIEQETGLAFYITLTGFSVPPMHRLETAIERTAAMQKARTKRGVNIFDFVVTMTSEKDDGSPAYMVKFLKVELMKPEDSAAFGPLYMQLMQRKTEIETEQAADEGAGQVIDGDTEAI